MHASMIRIHCCVYVGTKNNTKQKKLPDKLLQTSLPKVSRTLTTQHIYMGINVLPASAIRHAWEVSDTVVTTSVKTQIIMLHKRCQDNTAMSATVPHPPKQKRTIPSGRMLYTVGMSTLYLWWIMACC